MSSLRTLLFAAGFMTIGALGATATTAMARPGGHRGGPPIMKMGKLIASLDLSEAQEAALLDLREEMVSEFKSARGENKDEMEAIIEAVKTDTVDRQAIHDLIDTAAAERTAMAHTATDRVLDIYDTLTVEQKAALKERIETVETRHEQMRERKGGERERGHNDE